MPLATLAASLICSDDFAENAKTPVLLLSGTSVDPFEQYDWNYIPVLEAAGYPWCVSIAPEQNTGDIQIRAEYVVHAIRTMSSRAGRKIAIVGHSQGGMVPRWALRFWSDTRAMVSEVIAASPSNNGSQTARGQCSLPCAAAFWQQRDNANFIAALNQPVQTFAGISYTSIYTELDEVVVPATSAVLTTGNGRIANISLQSLCPGHLADHLATGTFDAPTLALVLDALAHDGPADVTRIDPAVCQQLAAPGVVKPLVALDALRAAVNLTMGLTVKSTRLTSEPALACYVTQTCSLSSR
ncbi:MAG: lipase [Pseudomonadota bacterium]